MAGEHKKLSLFVFIDALGWEIVKQRSLLDDVLTEKRPLDTVFGYSSSCDPTILTGLMPRDHGHLSFFVYAPETSPFRVCRYLDILPHTLTRRGRVRRQMSRLIQRYYGFTGYFQIYNMPFRYLPLFDYSERRDIYQVGGINSGAPTIFDHLRHQQIPFHVSDWRLPEERRIEALEADLEKRPEIQFAYLFLGDIDAVLHSHGTRSPIVDEKVLWYDRRLRRLLDQVDRRYQDLALYMFSDHGMTDIVEDCDLIQRVAGLDLRFGVDYAAVYDSTMARFWFLKKGVRDQVAETLAGEPRGHILTSDELVKYGCDFADSRYGELFFLLDPGVLLCPSFMGEKSLPGMHGFAPEHPDSIAAFLSNRALAEPPGRLDDLYSLMLAEAS